MQIGGYDLVIPTRFNPDETLSHAVNAIQRVWGSIIVEVDSPPEIFVYRSQEAVDAWTSLGWNKKYAKDMVYLIASSDHTREITVVLEDPKDPELAKVLEAITEALKP